MSFESLCSSSALVIRSSCSQMASALEKKLLNSSELLAFSCTCNIAMNVPKIIVEKKCNPNEKSI